MHLLSRVNYFTNSFPVPQVYYPNNEVSAVTNFFIMSAVNTLKAAICFNGG